MLARLVLNCSSIGLGACRVWDICRRLQGAGGLRAEYRCRLSINGQRGRCNKRGGDQSKRASVYHKAPPLLDHSPYPSLPIVGGGGAEGAFWTSACLTELLS